MSSITCDETNSRKKYLLTFKQELISIIMLPISHKMVCSFSRFFILEDISSFVRPLIPLVSVSDDVLLFFSIYFVASV